MAAPTRFRRGSGSAAFTKIRTQKYAVFRPLALASEVLFGVMPFTAPFIAAATGAVCELRKGDKSVLSLHRSVRIPASFNLEERSG